MKKLALLTILLISLDSYCKKLTVEEQFQYGAFALTARVDMKAKELRPFLKLYGYKWYETNVRASYLDYWNKLDKDYKSEEELGKLLSDQLVFILESLGLQIDKYKVGIYIDSKHEIKKEQQFKTRTGISIALIVSMIVIL